MKAPGTESGLSWSEFFKPDWLSRRREEALDPELPIIDPHHHIWAWLDYGLDEFLADICAGHNVRATVHLESGLARNEADPEHQLHLEAEPPSSETIAAVYCPFFDPCVEAFGAERCMFESNYP